MDVRILSPRDKNPSLSAYMQAKAKIKTGEVLNACPFRCQGDDLDEFGYCRHLVGFTNSTEQECKEGQGQLEPLVQVGEQRRVICRREKRTVAGPDGKKVQVAGPPILEPVLPSDVLVRITTSSRVYRDVDSQKPVKE